MQSAPVWVRSLYSEMNVTLTFLKTVTLGDKPEIQLAASSLYRIFVNGALIGYGPARAAHGFSRIHRYSLGKWAGGTVVVAVGVGFAPVGSMLGSELAKLSYRWILVPLGMLIGYFIVKAEPAEALRGLFDRSVKGEFDV